jgi:pimeloyl-ACP methyl ester carboxylesterase
VGHFADTIGSSQSVTVVGHSFGGGVAITTAHRSPDLAERLVLVNSIGGTAWADCRGVGGRPPGSDGEPRPELAALAERRLPILVVWGNAGQDHPRIDVVATPGRSR